MKRAAQKVQYARESLKHASMELESQCARMVEEYAPPAGDTQMTDSEREELDTLRARMESLMDRVNYVEEMQMQAEAERDNYAEQNALLEKEAAKLRELVSEIWNKKYGSTNSNSEFVVFDFAPKSASDDRVAHMFSGLVLAL